ncbi:MAG: type I DNA topoisomerase [Deltaproteobacteria bacterium]|jgi:DNA topoisomerase-1|nr:type I DNA topoisomerase [Deltaproteobacteria bacterium]
MKLLIVESPGKIKKIQSFLGAGWRVAASIGHVRDLPPNHPGVYPPDFVPQYEATLRGQKVIKDLKLLTDQAEEVFLATDPDREGEAIAWHLKEALNLVDPPRVTYTEITSPAIKKALANPRPIDDNLVQAQLGRRTLDRLVGYGVSPAVSGVAGKTLSAGRVQTPALRIIVEREQAIQSFKSTTYYGVELNFGPQPANVFSSSAPDPLASQGQDAVLSEGLEATANWTAVWNPKNWLEPGQERFVDKKIAAEIAALKTLTAEDYEEGRAQKNPPPPFTTSTLQQAASNHLKLNPKKTMEIAQRLYEAGLITYMRTDSQALSDEAIKDIRKVAGDKNWPLPKEPRVFKAPKGAQEAHEAIRPTDMKVDKAGDDPLAQALYNLIWKRTMASQLANATYATAKATLGASLNGRKAVFEAKGRRLIEPGWKTVLTEDQADESKDRQDAAELNNPVPKLTLKANYSPIGSKVKTSKTNPPPRFTQAALIRELEKRGIGRPSTYAAILDNIMTRGYIVENKKRMLESTQLGDELISYLKSTFGFVDYEYTKLLEEKLDQIAQGQLDYLSVVSKANDVLESELKKFSVGHGANCPVCGGPLKRFVKEGPGGYRFWACLDRERCGATFKDQNNRPGAQNHKSELTNELCPKCGQNLYHIVKIGPNGYAFWACANKTQCGAIFSDNQGAPGELSGRNELTDQLCSDCGQPLNHIVKDGPTGYNFWACSNLDSCGAKFKDNNGQPGEKQGRREVSDKNCQECGQPLIHLVKDGPNGYNFWACSDRDNCGAKFKDNNGSPGEKSQRAALSDQICQSCGQPLSHLVKDGPNGYNFWACSNTQTCGAKYKDNNGSPGEKQGRREVSDELCLSCGQPLNHLVKDGPNGYNFWACSDRDNCGAKFKDNNGKPGERSQASASLTDEKCQSCGQPLNHIVKEGANGYNFWACSDRANCGSTFKDDNGKPGDKNQASSLTDEKCQSCGQPLSHIVKEGANGYNFWACSDRANCGSTFKDDNGKPGEKQGSRRNTSVQCPACGQSSLDHVIKDGPNGYNFWACSDRANCGAKFQDNNGQPGEKSGKSTLSEFKCPDCGLALNHIVKEGPNGYNFWACSDRNCGAKFQDNNGEPGEKSGKSELTSHVCEVCGQRLKRLTKDGPTGYNFWACSDRNCGTTYQDDNGAPGPKNPPRDKPVLSDFKCPACHSPLIRRKGTSRKTGEDYDFYSCSNRSCQTTYRTRNDEPVLGGAAQTTQEL